MQSYDYYLFAQIGFSGGLDILAADTASDPFPTRTQNRSAWIVQVMSGWGSTLDAAQQDLFFCLKNAVRNNSIPTWVGEKLLNLLAETGRGDDREHALSALAWLKENPPLRRTDRD